MLKRFSFLWLCFGTTSFVGHASTYAVGDEYIVQQITFGPHHHFFGYIGHVNDQQVLYDTDTKKVIGQLGSPEFFPQPGGDIALSPDGTRFVNGYGNRNPGVNFYTILSRTDNKLIRTRPFSRGEWTSGPLRLDPAPKWNRDGDQIRVSAIADDPQHTRQLFVVDLRK